MALSAKKRISKSTLSMFLRTKCDRELYLSLHEDKELAAHSMPVPLQARPGIGALEAAGRAFEDERNEQLIRAFGNQVVFQSDKAGSNKPVKAPLDKLLGKISSFPSILLQAKFDPVAIQSAVMTNIGLSLQKAAAIPPIAGLIPDIIIARSPEDGDFEVQVDGSRKEIEVGKESRRALSIVDVKHTGEANPSYAAEVALYALLLANWLEQNGFGDLYFVTTKCYLWTRFKQGDAEFDKLLSASATVSHSDFLKALVSDSEDAMLRFYLSTVLHFFREDIPRVIQIGDAAVDGWRKLEWHVDGRCSACDWLGHAKWVNASDKARIASNPDHYCFPSAQLSGHVSQIAGMTRGARKTLGIHAITSTASVAGVSGGHPAFQNHSHLKKERNRLPSRAQALISSTLTTDASAVLASLSPYPQLHVAVSINFDASAGLLTGLSVMGRATAYVSGQSPRQFAPRAFIVDQKSLGDEWIALEGFLSAISDIVTQSSAYVRAAGRTPLTAQIAFWDKRQFEELCAAVGRHLPRIFALSSKKTMALAWLFPADELIERADGAVSPCIVFIDEIVKRVVFAPTPHVITLLDTAELYFSGPYPIKLSDPYYREFLTNGIPRERIYEIWSSATSIRRGSVVIPRNTVIQEFGNALEKQCRALNSIVERLRADFKLQLKANAPKLSLSLPKTEPGIAFDSKLWVWWEELQHSTRKIEAHQRLALDAETLEASYEAVRLTNGTATSVQDVFEFDVLSGSTEAKLDDMEGFLVLGKEGRPGLPLERARDILKPAAPVYPGVSHNLSLPLWSTLSVTLMSFDRAARKATVRFSNYRDPHFASYVVANAAVDLLSDVFITKGQVAFKWYERVLQILKEVGNPAIASPDLNAAASMGLAAIPPGADLVTPAARVLWDAGRLNSTSVVSAAKASAIAGYAQAMHQLNVSQKAAVEHAAEKALTVIWGPPGTGKTKTLAALMHGLVEDSTSSGLGLKILVAGPTYKAVEELISRVIVSIGADAVCSADVFVAYSSSQKPMVVPKVGSNVNAISFNIDQGSSETQACINSLIDTTKVTIIATSTMQAYKFSEFVCARILGPVFDVAVLDESSQIQVTTAVSPLSTLKDAFRLVIAGDHLQMPPILALEPPAGAEYLVGSIQKYLISRSFGLPVNDCPLEHNYRSAEDVVAFARMVGYRKTLSAAFPATSLHQLVQFSSVALPASLPYSVLWQEALDPARKVLTLLHEDELSSQSNEFEAKIVASLVWLLRMTMSGSLDGQGASAHAAPSAAEFWGRCVGIVTPHRAQRALVVRELRALFPLESLDLIDGAVDTVEKFQGGERHTVLVTFGVGDSDVIMGEESFLMQLERTNVAISRAMAKCIVIMPQNLAGHVPGDKKALETAHALKDYVEEFCNVEIRGSIDMGGQIRAAKLRYRA